MRPPRSGWRANSCKRRAGGWPTIWRGRGEQHDHRSRQPPSDSACLWCGHPYRARRGGSPQRFCRTRCRITFWSALRQWDERAIAAGTLTVIDLRNGATAACTLQGEPVLRGSPQPSYLRPRRQFPACSPRGERRRKLTGSLDDFLITLFDLPRLVRYRRHALVRRGYARPGAAARVRSRPCPS